MLLQSGCCYRSLLWIDWCAQGDIKARRNYHKVLSTDEAEEAALDDAWNLVHGVAEEAPCVDFKIMPSTEHILSVMEEVYKQYKGTFFE